MRLFLLLIAVAFAPSTALAADPIVGRASVVDGDTIEIHGQRIRLNGIDAPEARQMCTSSTGEAYRCGKVSADALDKFLAHSRPTKCIGTGKDRYRRIVANCSRLDGEDVAGWMVRNGYAFDWPRYSKGAFAAAQSSAKASGIGVWQGPSEAPWEWRKNR